MPTMMPSLSLSVLLFSSAIMTDAFVLPSRRRALPSMAESSSLHMEIPSQIFDPNPTTFMESSPLSFDSTLLLSSSTNLAQSLGYFVGIASLLLYTPIAIRLLRTKSADGLTLSTWWCKLTAFTCSDVYNIRSGFPIAAFSETVVITVEALIVLLLVTYYQKQWNGVTASLVGVYFTITAWALLSPSNAVYSPTEEVISCAQVAATFLNSAALLPQLHQNFIRRSSGGYSPVTAAIGSGGCSIRLFTTVALAGADPLMLMNYGVALLLNISVLSQILYFGTQKEQKSIRSLFMADLV